MNEIDCDGNEKKPTRSTSKTTDGTIRKEEQESNDIIHKAEIDNWMKEKNTHKKELAKSCALMLSHCSAVMKSRIEALPNYESEIRDNPVKLPEAIQNKMHDPERNRHPCESVTEAFR